MRIAKDGKPFDVDNIPELHSDEVEIIQFLRPDGRRRRMAVSVGLELGEKAKNLIISAEELTTGEIAVYVRKIGEPEEKESIEIAVNGPGEKSPTECVKRLIRKKEEINDRRTKSKVYRTSGGDLKGHEKERKTV